MNTILSPLRSKTILTSLISAAAVCSVLADGAPYISGTHVDGISVKNGVLCWKHTLDSAPSTVYRAPALGGKTAQLYYNTGVDPNRPVSRNADTDSSRNTYWISAAGKVVQHPMNADDTTPPTEVATLENTSFLAESLVSVAGNRIFWSEMQGEVGNGGKVFWAPKGGGSRTLVYDTNPVSSYVTQLMALSDSEALFLTANGRLYHSADIAGSWLTVQIYSDVQSFTVTNGRIFYARSVGSDVELRSRPLAGGASDLHYVVTGGPAPAVREIVADATNIYWREFAFGSGAIRRHPLVGGSAATLHSTVSGNHIGLTLNGGWLYWVGADETSIWRVSTNATPDEIDLAVTSTEVVQVVQNPTNSVPLIAGKPTYVRVFANIASTNNRTSVSNWPMAQLRVVNPATGLELGVLPSINGTRVSLHTGANNRANADEAFIFGLPSDWSTLPSLQITAELNPRRVVTETSYANNSQTVTASFQRKAPIWIEATPLSAYRSETFSGYHPAYEALFERAESMLPVPAVLVSWRGGPPVDKIVAVFDLPPWENRPIELTSGFERGFWAQRQLATRAIFNSRPASAIAQNANYHCVGFYTPGAAGNLGGEAPYFLRGAICEMQLDAGMTDFNSAAGGVTLAHELGHNYVLEHLPVGGAPAPYAGFISPPYPYPPNRYNDLASSMLGLDPITGKPIPNGTGELMGYLRPRWMSDYSYTRILANIRNLPAGVAVPRPRPARSGGGSVWMLSGFLSPDGDQVATPVAVPDTAAQTELAAQIAAGDVTRYRFRITRADASSYTVAAATGDGADGPAASSFLVGCMTPDTDAVKVGIESVEGLGEITSITGGGAAPDFTITTPIGGETFTTPFFAQWDTSDPEGNTIRTLVRYSHDGGTTWMTLAEELPLEKLRIDPTQLPGGTDCRLQFIASDGIRSKVTTSASFTIPAKPPTAYITLRNSSGAQHGLATLRATAGERLRLEGRGHDLEHGLPKSYTWSVSNGFRTHTGTASSLELPALQPGTWNVTLTIADEDNNPATATATLVVDALHFADAPSDITLDGIPDEPAWLSDTHPQAISYGTAEGRAPAEIRMVRRGSNFYVAGSGLAVGLNASEFIGLIFDLNASGDGYPQPGDLRFDVFADGRTNRLTGNGTDYTLQASPDFAARVALEPGSDSWSFEAEIPATLLGGWSGQNVKINVSHFHRNFIGDDYAWLGLAVEEWNWPYRWADAVFGADPYDPTDADGNGIADAWEVTHFGLTGVSATADDDGDGQSNGAEFAANTAPLQPSSRFVASPTAAPGGGFQLDWTSSLDRSYTVWSSTDLENWAYVSGPIAGTGAPLSHTLPAGGDTKKFFKVTARWNR